MMRRLVKTTIALLLLLIGCTNEPAVVSNDPEILLSVSDCQFEQTARIYRWPQGTFSLIDGYDHLWYATDLPEEFQRDGITVYVEFEPLKHVQFEEGYPIYIISIEEIK